jgi:hypothetical protein
MAAFKRDHCEGCGCGLCAAELWYSVHDGRRTLRVCRPCLEDGLARRDAEARLQAGWLESLWELTPRQVGGDEIGVP